MSAARRGAAFCVGRLARWHGSAATPCQQQQLLLGACWSSSSSSSGSSLLYACPHRHGNHGWQQSRWQSSSSAAAGDGMAGLMDGLSAAKLKDQLDARAETQPCMPYPQLLGFIKAQGAADTDAEAAARADALQRAGVILRYNGLVYLRPQEIAELVLRALPSDAASARQQVSVLDQELTAMDRQLKSIQASARRWPRFWNAVGCVLMFGQLAGMVYLTYYELSWDVMEPIAYLMGLTYSFLAYVYFMATRGSYLDYGPFQEYWEAELMKKRLQQRGFNMERYQHLIRTKERYGRYLQAQADAPDWGAAPAAHDAPKAKDA